MSFHPVVWVTWTFAAITAVVVRAEPTTTLAVLAVTVLAGARFAPRDPAGRVWSLFLRIGLIFIVVRTVLFGLTGHTGATTLAELPSVTLPDWLGALSIGGRITGEVVSQSIFEGLNVAVILVAIGVAQSIVPPHRALRMLPRVLFEAGLVVGIAITFAPTLLKTAADVREAQRARGHRFRGLRSWRALIVPLLATSLERSMTLAASMEARGFGRGARADAGRDRAVLAAGVLALTAGMGLVLFGRAIGLVPLAAGVAMVVVGLRGLARGVTRTRLRAAPATHWDLVTAVAAGAAIVGAFAGRAFGAPAWTPYPTLSWPSVDLIGLLIAAALAAPFAIAALRARVVARAEQAAAPQGALATGAVR